MIVGRCLAGFGAALELPVSLAIVANAFPDPSKRAVAIGIWSVAAAWPSRSGRRWAV